MMVDTDSDTTQAIEWTQVRVSKEAREIANGAKRDDETWSDYLVRCADAEPGIQQVVPVEDVVGALDSEDREGLTLADVKQATAAAVRDELAEVSQR